MGVEGGGGRRRGMNDECGETYAYLEMERTMSGVCH